MAKRRHPVLDYLEALQAVHATGKATAEQSYKSALEALLTAIGADFDPVLFATMELSGEGAGHPDLGVFERKSGNLRLVVEVKPTRENIFNIATGTQVSKYWKRYGFVLVTNLREFVLVARESGEVRVESRYQISSTSEAFWRSKPSALADEHEQGLRDFIEGVFARPAPILKPRDLAADLARHAREAKRRLGRHSMADLRPLQEAFEESLGLKLEDEKGERFFRSSLVQTLFYGLFSGWMLWRQSLSKGKVAPAFDWKDASEYLALPLLADLFDEVAKPRRLGELGMREPIEWATTSLNRVDQAEFFRTFDEDHAITLFYEPFLQAFDPELRKELGVWYTPPEIVRYMVGRVDELLRSDLGIADGLADERVYVLDPAAGTGSYLVEVAKRIHATLVEQGHESLAAAKVRKALCERVFGFEILTAPYIVAHLQLGVLLRAIGAKLASKDRPGVYLTNALTGWEPPKGVKRNLAFPFLQEEQDAAANVKQKAPIIVILGNPPYNRYAGVAEEEEADLIDPYKDGLYEKWGVRKQLLDDLYIRFFRLGEKRIGEVSKRGVVCFISNYSWLDGISHPIMRERILTAFDTVYIDNCNGDKYKTGKRTPDGKPDESMFTTDDHRVGIQVGTAIATLVANGSPKKPGHVSTVQYREFWGTGNVKREALLGCLDNDKKGDALYSPLAPSARFRWVLAGGSAHSAGYGAWRRLIDLIPVHYSGLNENRQGMLMADDREELARRMADYFNPKIPHDEIAESWPALVADAARFDGRQTRTQLHKLKMAFNERYLVRLAFRPFDETWLYWVGQTKLLNEKRDDFFQQCWRGNLFLSASQTGRKGGFNQPFLVDKFGDLHLQDPWSQFFPMLIREEGMFASHAPQPNIASDVLEVMCASAGIPMRDEKGHAYSEGALDIARKLFFHSLAVLWSPAYRSENEAALRQDWPRIPIPTDIAVLTNSAALGERLAGLLLPDRSVPGVTAGKLRPELKALGTPTKPGHKAIDPDTDLEVTASWGFRNKAGAIMCGQGRVTPSDGNAGGALDVWINDRVCWRNVPLDVWNTVIGGYPVIKKWLSYREKRVLGRPLRMDEVTYVTDVIRRLKAIILLGDELDASFHACGVSTIKSNSAESPVVAVTAK